MVGCCCCSGLISQLSHDVSEYCSNNFGNCCRVDSAWPYATRVHVDSVDPPVMEADLNIKLNLGRRGLFSTEI